MPETIDLYRLREDLRIDSEFGDSALAKLKYHFNDVAVIPAVGADTLRELSANIQREVQASDRLKEYMKRLTEVTTQELKTLESFYATRLRDISITIRQREENLRKTEAELPRKLDEIMKSYEKRIQDVMNGSEIQRNRKNELENALRVTIAGLALTSGQENYVRKMEESARRYEERRLNWLKRKIKGRETERVFVGMEESILHQDPVYQSILTKVRKKDEAIHTIGGQINTVNEIIVAMQTNLDNLTTERDKLVEGMKSEVEELRKRTTAELMDFDTEYKSLYLKYTAEIKKVESFSLEIGEEIKDRVQTFFSRKLSTELIEKLG